jgi:hypothetical protein
MSDIMDIINKKQFLFMLEDCRTTQTYIPDFDGGCFIAWFSKGHITGFSETNETVLRWFNEGNATIVKVID